MTVATIASLVSGLNRSLGSQDSKVADAVRAVVSKNQPTLPPKFVEDTTTFPTAAVLQNQVASLKVASQNIAQASVLLDTAGAGAEAVAEVLGQLQDLAARASTQDLSVSERVQLSGQVQALRQAIIRINATSGGQDNSAEASPFAVGDFSEAALFDNAELDVSTPEAAQQAANTVATAQDYVEAQVATVQEFQNGIEVAAATIESAIQNQDATNSTLSDSDLDVFAEATPEQAALQDQKATLLAQTGRLPNNILQLLAE